MAKSSKGGLGRGIGSLFGGTLEPAAPATPSPTVERVTVNEEEDALDKDLPKSSLVTNKPAYANTQVSTPTQTKEVASETYKPVATSQTTSVSYPMREIKPVQRVIHAPQVETPQTETKVDIKEIIEKKLDEVPIEKVKPNPDQPRTSFNKEELEELSVSIEKNGVLQPILVRALKDGTYQIIAGERRWQACKLLKMKTIPVRIKEADEDKALELALIENIQRSDLNPIEEAYGYKRLMERRKMTQAEVAQVMSKGRSTVANALRLLDLPEEAQQLLFEEKITAGHARAILSIPDKEGRQTLTKKLAEEKLSVREAESLARLLAGKDKAKQTPRQPTPAAYKAVAKALRDTLKTNVRVKSVKGKNKIEIEFKDEEDLKRLLDEMTSRNE